MSQKNERILEQVQDFCNKNLDKDYTELCSKIHTDLLLEDEEVFKRGKAEIWAAAIVWAAGSLNFLGDKSFSPYSTLNDVCNFFDANCSTVGQKKRKIDKMLDITWLSTEYRIETENTQFIDSLRMTPEGFIVPANMLDEDEWEEEDTTFEEEEDDGNTYYKLIFQAVSKSSNAQIYQLEYLLKKMLRNVEQLIEFNRLNNREIHFLFRGFWETVEKITEKTEQSGFVISEVYYAESAEDLPDFTDGV